MSTAIILHAAEAANVAELDGAINRLASSASVRQPLVIRPGGRDLWCWLPTRSVIEGEVLDRHDAWLRERGIVACVGSSLEGLPGFALSHREAREVQRLDLRAVRASGVVRYPDVELLTLTLDSPERAERFARRTLGPLASDDEASVRLRETLAATLSTNSVDEAAAILNVHKNTVRYRIAQAERHLGRSVNGSTEVDLALRYYEWFLAGPR